jgi:peptidoglycan/xylan/chitin deacetylase (PgdA/CDA1 family)
VRRVLPFALAAGAAALALTLRALVPAADDPTGLRPDPALARDPDSTIEAGAGAGGQVAPLSPRAAAWVREHRELIRRTASGLGVPSIALAGVVAAEQTLLHDPHDAVVDAVFRAYLSRLSERDLRGWAAEQETAYRRRLAEGEEPGLQMLKSPYLWSVGPAQVSFRNAFFQERRLARLQGRAERTLEELVRAVLTPAGSLEYAAVLLLDAQEAYARYAGVDLRRRPGVLATLYHLGSPARRALRLEEENRLRDLRGEIRAEPQVNHYGAFVDGHAADLEELLR